MPRINSGGSGAAEAAEEGLAFLGWLFDAVTSPTAPATPATGRLRLNHATPSSVTQVFIHKTDDEGVARGPEIAFWDDTYATAPAVLTIRSRASPQNYVEFTVSGVNIDSSTYFRVLVTYKASVGTFVDGEQLALFFSAAPDVAIGYLSLTEGRLWPSTWTRPSAAVWTTATRGSVADSGYGALTAHTFTASRSCFVGRPRVGDAAFRHEMEIDPTVMRSSAPGAGGVGLQLNDNSDWYGWSSIGAIDQIYEQHEVATVPQGAAIRAWNGRVPRFWALGVGDSSGGTQTVTIEFSVDGVRWKVLVTKAGFAKVGATGIYCAPGAATSEAEIAVQRERYA